MLDEDELMAEPSAESPLSALLPHTLCAIEDPAEKELGSSRTLPLSGELYIQRTEVFESLLEFIGSDDKQPPGDLVQLVEGAEWN